MFFCSKRKRRKRRKKGENLSNRFRTFLYSESLSPPPTPPPPSFFCGRAASFDDCLSPAAAVVVAAAAAAAPAGVGAGTEGGEEALGFEPVVLVIALAVFSSGVVVLVVGLGFV